MRPDRRWHPDDKLWSLPDTPENRAWADMDAGAGTALLPISPDFVPFPHAVPLSKAEKADEARYPARQDSLKNGPNDQQACTLRDGRIFYTIEMARIERRAAIKRIPDCQWHPEQKKWSVPDTPENRERIREIHRMPREETRCFMAAW